MANIFQMNARDAKEITKSDSAPTYQTPMAALYVGGAGDVCLITVAAFERGTRLGTAFASMDTITITVPAGGVLNIQIAAIKSTGTTATDLIALYP